MDSLREFGRLGNFLGLAVASLLIMGSTSPALALGDHKQKVYVPVTPVYTVPTATVAQSPVAAYSYAPLAGAPVATVPMAGAPIAMAPSNGIYYAPTVGPQVSMAPATYIYSTTANAPQVYNPGTAFSPTGSGFAGTVPPRIGDSRMTDDGRKDVLDDLRDAYRQEKTSQGSRTALRKTLKDMAREKYVEVIGSDVQAPEDLKDSENKEIDQIVDIVMREDSSANSQSPYGYPNQYSYSNGYVPQPMYYYYVYPIAPVAHPHHQHHLLHRQ